MSEFNRQRMMENVNELIKEKGLKVGEVESAIGVSTGYISRLTKKETDTAPSADIVWKLAKYLGVSTDMLIEGDFSKATHNLQYMRNFVLKLKAMTDSNKLEWGAITIQDINSALQNEEDGEETLPIIAHRENAALNIKEMQIRKDARYRDCSLPEYGNKRVKSSATEERVWTCGSGFQAYLSDGTTVFIFKLEGNFRLNDDGDCDVLAFYDIYFGKNILNPDFEGGYPPGDEDFQYTFLPVCSTLNNAYDIGADIALLYRSISRHEHDLKISQDVRNSIDHFLNENECQNYLQQTDEEFPFN